MAKVSIRNFQRKINNLNLLNEEIRRISKSAVKATAQALKEMAIDDITSAWARDYSESKFLTSNLTHRHLL
jgi:hypothetical protein